MLLRNGELRGADINFTHHSDVLGPFKSVFFSSLQFAYPKVLFVACTFNNPLTALSVTARDKYGTNDQNAALWITDPAAPQPEALEWMRERGVQVGAVNPDDWVLVQGATFDFCQIPVRIFGRHCSIEYSEPALSRSMFTLDEWRKLEAIYAERGRQMNDDTNLAQAGQRERQRATRNGTPHHR